MPVTNFPGSKGTKTPIAYLDGNEFPFYLNSLMWGYQLNTATFDTVGGRVIQLLSTKITTMTAEGEAGDRPRILKLYQEVINIQEKQIKTQQPVQLLIPTRGWTFNVWVRAIPTLGWNVRTVTYPWRMTFEIDEVNDAFGTITRATNQDAISQLAKLEGNIATSATLHWTGMGNLAKFGKILSSLNSVEGANSNLLPVNDYNASGAENQYLGDSSNPTA